MYKNLTLVLIFSVGMGYGMEEGLEQEKNKQQVEKPLNWAQKILARTVITVRDPETGEKKQVLFKDTPTPKWIEPKQNSNIVLGSRQSVTLAEEERLYKMVAKEQFERDQQRLRRQMSGPPHIFKMKKRRLNFGDDDSSN